MANLKLLGEVKEGYEEILSDDALSFVENLVREFQPRIESLLAEREKVQARFDAGERPAFVAETKSIRESEWKVGALPHDLIDRRVEITGPPERKMVINALNSGAKVFMADFEDSNAPTWANNIEGQINLRDAVAGTIDYVHPVKDKTYELADETATLMVRPRGLHLVEAHIELDGKPVPGALVDFGLYFFHNVATLLEQGSGPYFYLPKLENRHEARLWNDVFVRAQRLLDVPVGTIKATVLIETITASFEMDEILYELRDHSAGLNCGRWDYIFSFIKKFRNDPKAVMPDRGQIGMSQPFMNAYSLLLIKTCHKRGVHAMGGMAAQIPIKGDPEANAAALEKVRVDKEREARNGHDGTWVAHPGLVGIALEAFDAVMKGDNQLDVARDDVSVTAADLLEIPTGTRTVAGLRTNIKVGIQYIEAWLRGNGCVPLYNLMEDAATAEISRSQVWQWLTHGADVGGEKLTVERFDEVLAEELDALRDELGESFEAGKFDEASALFRQLCVEQDFTEFLTLPAYQYITSE